MINVRPTWTDIAVAAAIVALVVAAAVALVVGGWAWWLTDPPDPALSWPVVYRDDRIVQPEDLP